MNKSANVEAVFLEFEKLGITPPSYDQMNGGFGADDAPRILRAGAAPPPSAPQARAFWWGLQIYVDAAYIGWARAVGMVQVAGHFLAAVIFPPAAPFALAAAATFMANLIGAEAANAQNGNRGIYMSMLWIAPGIFVLTPA